MIEDEAAQQVVAFYDAILKSRGIRLAPDSMILDYGCGSGRHTYEYVDAGFRNAFGYDVQNYVALRAPADRERFRFDPLPSNVGGYPTMSQVPWPDNTFDFVFATSVFEHVMDQEVAYAGIIGCSSVAARSSISFRRNGARSKRTSTFPSAVSSPRDPILNFGPSSAFAA